MTNEGIFKNTSTKKEWLLQGINKRLFLTNQEIVGESIVIKQSLCSENELKFGSCEVGTFEVTIVNDGGASLVDTQFHAVVKVIQSSGSFNMVDIGNFNIIEDNISSDRKTRKIKAVNSMYYVLNTNVSDWYNNLTFPIKIKDLRDGLFSYLIGTNDFCPTQQAISFSNDNLLINKTIEGNDITGAVVITAICEFIGVFGRISPMNVFEYVSLNKRASFYDLYPAEDLYPSDELYPSEKNVADEYIFNKSEYFSIDYANYMTTPIDSLIIRSEENDIGYVISSTEVKQNTYVLQDNFLCYGMSSEELQNVAIPLLYDYILATSYTPIRSAVTYGNPLLKVGDAIGFEVDNGKYIKSYILERTLTGVNALKDTYVAKGVETYKYAENNTTAFLNQLRGKTAKVEATVEGISIEVEDLAESTTTRFEQTAESISAEVTRATEKEGQLGASIELKVGKDDNDQVVSMINASANVVSLKGNRVEIESDNFNLDRAGNVSANGTFTSVKNDNVYAELQGNGVHLFHNSVEIGALAGTTSDGVFIGGNQSVGIGNQNNTFYYCNNGLNPGGLTERHLFTGTSRFTNRVYLGTSDSSIGSINYAEGNGVALYNSAYVYGSLGCSGTKYRVVDTESYGKRGLNAYETAYAQFGDNGSGTCDDNGLCEIEFEPIFAETIDLSKPYQVFLTQTSEKVTKWVEKKDDRFIIHGEPGATFDYMIVARQKDYSNVRLEKIDIPNIESEVTE